MQTASGITYASNNGLWAGRIISGLAVLFLLFDGAIKLVPLEIVLETSAQMGLPANADFARTLGMLRSLRPYSTPFREPRFSARSC